MVVNSVRHGFYAIIHIACTFNRPFLNQQKENNSRKYFLIHESMGVLTIPVVLYRSLYRIDGLKTNQICKLMSFC